MQLAIPLLAALLALLATPLATQLLPAPLALLALMAVPLCNLAIPSHTAPTRTSCDVTIDQTLVMALRPVDQPRRPWRTPQLSHQGPTRGRASFNTLAGTLSAKSLASTLPGRSPRILSRSAGWSQPCLPTTCRSQLPTRYRRPCQGKQNREVIVGEPITWETAVKEAVIGKATFRGATRCVCHFPTTSCHISTLLRNESRGFHRKCGLVLSDPLRSSETLSDPPRSLNFTKAQLDLVQPDEVTAPRLLQSREPHQTHHFTKPTLGLCPNLGHFPLFNTRTLPNLANFTPEFRLAPILNSPNSTTWAASKPTGFLVGGRQHNILAKRAKACPPHGAGPTLLLANPLSPTAPAAAWGPERRDGSMRWAVRVGKLRPRNARKRGQVRRRIWRRGF